MKVCTKCKQEKDINEFAARKGSKDGKNGICRQCVIEYDREYRLKNHDKLLQRKRKWINNNRSHVNECNRKYKKENSEKEKQYKTNYNSINREQINKKNLDRYIHNRKQLGSAYINSLLRQSGFTTDQINENPELVEIRRLIIKTKRLCETLKN